MSGSGSPPTRSGAPAVIGVNWSTGRNPSRGESRRGPRRRRPRRPLPLRVNFGAGPGSRGAELQGWETRRSRCPAPAPRADWGTGWAPGRRRGARPRLQPHSTRRLKAERPEPTLLAGQTRRLGSFVLPPGPTHPFFALAPGAIGWHTRSIDPLPARATDTTLRVRRERCATSA
jgi:hypothetical protein